MVVKFLLVSRHLVVSGVDDVGQVAGHDVVEYPEPHAALHYRGKGEWERGGEEMRLLHINVRYDFCLLYGVALFVTDTPGC